MPSALPSFLPSVVPTTVPTHVPTSSPSKLYCDPGYQRIDNGKCAICPTGTYSIGTEALNVNASQQTECEVCPKGAWCDEGSANYTECTPGAAQNLTGQSSCNICTGGTFQNLSGQWSCLDCPPGTYCPQPNATWMNVQTLLCTPGSYSAAMSAECSKCPAGTFEENSGQGNACSGICDAGEYSGIGASECILCPADTYSDTPGTPYGCTQCPGGHLFYISTDFV